VEGSVTQPHVIALRCRTSERTPAPMRGAEALARALGARLGVEPRMIGSVDDDAAPHGYTDDLLSSRGCLLEAGGQVDDALTDGRLPVLTAGQCSIALTTLPTVARHRPDAKVLWLDAHGDFNTPDTTESSYLSGMALAGACGLWDSGFDGVMAPERVGMCGVRDLDSGERVLLEGSPVTVIRPHLDLIADVSDALDGAPTFVHLDLDVLDPAAFGAVDYPVPDGLPVDMLFDLLDAVADSCEVVGIEVTHFDAPPDAHEAERLAAVASRPITPLLFVPSEAGDGVD
jgi:arginase